MSITCFFFRYSGLGNQLKRKKYSREVRLRDSIGSINDELSDIEGMFIEIIFCINGKCFHYKDLLATLFLDDLHIYTRYF